MQILSGTCQGLSQTVSGEGSPFVLQKSTLAVATFGKEYLDLRIGSEACDGSGHHLERTGIS